MTTLRGLWLWVQILPLGCFLRKLILLLFVPLVEKDRGVRSRWENRRKEEYWRSGSMGEVGILKGWEVGEIGRNYAKMLYIFFLKGANGRNPRSKGWELPIQCTRGGRVGGPSRSPLFPAPSLTH